MNCLLWNRSGELKMSRNVMSTMIRILDVLKDYVSDEHKHRIKIEKCNIKANLEDETPVIEFVAKTKCYVKVLQNSFLNVFEYNRSLYIMAPSKSEAFLTRLGLNSIDDIVIYQAGTAIHTTCDFYDIEIYTDFINNTLTGRVYTSSDAQAYRIAKNTKVLYAKVPLIWTNKANDDRQYLSLTGILFNYTVDENVFL